MVARPRGVIERRRVPPEAGARREADGRVVVLLNLRGVEARAPGIVRIVHACRRMLSCRRTPSGRVACRNPPTFRFSTPERRRRQRKSGPTVWRASLPSSAGRVGCTGRRRTTAREHAVLAAQHREILAGDALVSRPCARGARRRPARPTGRPACAPKSIFCGLPLASARSAG